MVSGKGRDWGREYDDVRVDFGYRVYDQETVAAWGARMIVCPEVSLTLCGTAKDSGARTIRQGMKSSSA